MPPRRLKTPPRSLYKLADSRRLCRTKHGGSRGHVSIGGNSNGKRPHKRLDSGKLVIPVKDVFCEKTDKDKMASGGRSCEKRCDATPTKRPRGGPGRPAGVVRSASISKLQASLDGPVRITLRPSGIDGHGDSHIAQKGRNRRLDPYNTNEKGATTTPDVIDKGAKTKANPHNADKDKTSRRIAEQRAIIIANLRQATDLCKRYAKLTTLDRPLRTTISNSMAPNHGRDSTDGYLKRRRSGPSRHSSDASPSRPESCPLIKSSLRVRRCRSRSHSGARMSCAKHVRFSLPCNGGAGKLAGSSRRSVRQHRSASLPPVGTSFTAHRHGSR